MFASFCPYLLLKTDFSTLLSGTGCPATKPPSSPSVKANTTLSLSFTHQFTHKSEKSAKDFPHPFPGTFASDEKKKSKLNGYIRTPVHPPSGLISSLRQTYQCFSRVFHACVFSRSHQRSLGCKAMEIINIRLRSHESITHPSCW